MSAPTLTSLARCFQGVVPCAVATASADGWPNVTYVSHLHAIDDRHVALSRQFFNKTAKNLEENPSASIVFYDPITFEAYELAARFLRTETSGPLFDRMATRLDAIASHTGMAGVFKLIGADVLEVTSVSKVEGFITLPDACPEERLGLDGLRTELRGLQWVAERINRAPDLDGLLDAVLEALESYFGFAHTRVFLHEDGRLVTLASRGYDESSIGAEVALGEGLVGMVAKQRTLLRIGGLREGLTYGRAVRREVLSSGGDASLEIPLSGLPEAESALVIPLVVGDRLLGVLAAESPSTLAFDEWDEAYLDVVGNQIALGIDRMIERAREEESEAPAPSTKGAVPLSPHAKKRVFCLYKNDDAIFVDGEYLIRNVPARILWRVLTQWVREGRTEFTNRELRLDPSLGLPALKDNLESRLILLRKRLDEKCGEVRLVSTGRGRFALVVDGPLELVEKASA